jgi:hypothetical protein
VDVGKIYNLEVNFSNRPTKYAVCVCISTTEFLLVNSENKPHYDCIDLKKKGRPFPDYNCYISCSNTIKRDSSAIIAPVGELDRADATALLEKIRNSEYLEQKQIDRIVAGLEEYLNGLWDG